MLWKKKIKHDKEERECFGWSGVIVAILHKEVREGLIRRWSLSRISSAEGSWS